MPTAASTGTPNSMSRRAATTPVRPRPPRQCTNTRPPSARIARSWGPYSFHRSSNDSSGACVSTIGRWNQRRPPAATASPMWPTSSRSSSCCSMRVTTASAPQRRIRSRSASRSRSQSRVERVLGPFLPGQSVIPITPPALGIDTSPMRRAEGEGCASRGTSGSVMRPPRTRASLPPEPLRASPAGDGPR